MILLSFSSESATSLESTVSFRCFVQVPVDCFEDGPLLGMVCFESLVESLGRVLQSEDAVAEALTAGLRVTQQCAEFFGSVHNSW